MDMVIVLTSGWNYLKFQDSQARRYDNDSMRWFLDRSLTRFLAINLRGEMKSTLSINRILSISTTPIMLRVKTLPNPTVSVISIQRRWFPSQIHPCGLPILSKHHKCRKISINASWNGNGNGNGNGSNGLSNSNGESNGNGISSDDDGDDESGKANGRRGLNLRWAQLLLDPDPDNVLAVGLTGLLTWASVQVVWQLLVVSLAIVIAGLKYSLVAALLIFILIALL